RRHEDARVTRTGNACGTGDVRSHGHPPGRRESSPDADLLGPRDPRCACSTALCSTGGPPLVHAEDVVKKHVVVGLLVAALLLGSLAPPVSAGAGESVVLAEIIAVLRRMQTTLQAIREAASATRDTLELVYPAQALQSIQQVFDEVRTIRDEVGAISCGWRF